MMKLLLKWRGGQKEVKLCFLLFSYHSSFCFIIRDKSAARFFRRSERIFLLFIYIYVSKGKNWKEKMIVYKMFTISRSEELDPVLDAAAGVAEDHGVDAYAAVRARRDGYLDDLGAFVDRVAVGAAVGEAKPEAPVLFD